MKILLLLLVLVSTKGYAECGDVAVPVDANEVNKLVESINSKFSLNSSNVRFRCGGEDIVFRFPADSNGPSVRFNLVRIGSVSAENPLPALQAINSWNAETVSKLKQAAQAYVHDHEELEARLGIRAYVPNAVPVNRRIQDGKEVLYVSIPHCSSPERPTNGSSGDNVGEVYIPVISFETKIAANASVENFYKSGDLKLAISSTNSIRTRALQVVNDNVAVQRANPDAVRSICRIEAQNRVEGEESYPDDEKVNWSEVRSLFQGSDQ